MRPSLYTRLFTYRDRPGRSPKEDFLSEAFTDLLNRLPRAEVSALVESLFLCSSNSRSAWSAYLRANPRETLHWSSRRSIQSGGARYQLDILLETNRGTKLLVIENKIAAPLQEHAAPNDPTISSQLEANRAPARPSANQLQTYGRWLALECRDSVWPGAITLLTHARAAPDDFGQGNADAYGVSWQSVVHWSEVWTRLKTMRKRVTTGGTSNEQPDPTWLTLTAEFATLLEDWNMTAEGMTHDDLLATEAFLTSRERVTRTFEEIAAQIAPILTDLHCAKPHAWDFHAEIACVWAWAYLTSPPAPNEKNWYITWGIRFPARSRLWNDIDPPLPSTAHAFVLLGGGSNPYPTSNKKLSAAIPTGWSVVPWCDGFITAVEMDALPESERTTASLAHWVAGKVSDLRALLLLVYTAKDG